MRNGWLAAWHPAGLDGGDAGGKVGRDNPCVSGSVPVVSVHLHQAGMKGKKQCIFCRRLFPGELLKFRPALFDQKRTTARAFGVPRRNMTETRNGSAICTGVHWRALTVLRGGAGNGGGQALAPETHDQFVAREHGLDQQRLVRTEPEVYVVPENRGITAIFSG